MKEGVRQADLLSHISLNNNKGEPASSCRTPLRGGKEKTRKGKKREKGQVYATHLPRTEKDALFRTHPRPLKEISGNGLAKR